MKQAILALFLVLGTLLGLSPVLGQPDAWEALLDSVYNAEGSEMAKPAYGVVSWPDCGEVGACRYFAGEIIRVHYKRWVKAGNPGDFIDYLHSWYAPPEAHPLNRHWGKNVRKFYERATGSAQFEMETTAVQAVRG